MGKYVIQPHQRLQEWVAEEKGYFTDEGLDYEFEVDGLSHTSKQTSTVQSADEVPAEVRAGAFEDMSAGRTCDVSAACHWAVNGASTAGAGKMWGGAYSVEPSAIFVAPESNYHTAADLANVPVAVGFHSGSHYATLRALEPFLDTAQINLNFAGLPNDRARLLLRGEVQVANLFGPQYYVAEQLGYRKVTEATFMNGFLVKSDAEPEDTKKYFAAMQRAQVDIDLHPEKYLHYWARELPEDLLEKVDTRRFGPGERIVFLDYSKQMYDQTQAWMSTHNLLDLDDKASHYEDAVLV